MLRVLVADDEAPARRKLRRLLDGIGDIEVVGEAVNGDDAVERIAALELDLVLLDVQMPVMDGFEVVAAVGVDRMPPVVFVTAHDEYALRAFEIRALDYLLKPIATNRLRDAVDRVRQRSVVTASSDDRDAQRDAMTSLVRERPLQRILVHDDRSAHLLPVSAITLARAERNYVVLHTERGKFRLRGSISALADRLDSAVFLRVNRSDIVRLDAIRELHPWSHGDYRIVLGDGSALLWSRRFRAQVAGAFQFGG